MSQSERECEFLSLWERFGGDVSPIRQYRFHEKRRWRFDFAWPESLLGVEIQGGTAMRSRSGHTSISGIQKDYEKLNAAQLAGWRVLQYTSLDLEKRPLQLIAEIKDAL